jgi:hypothetical protein
MRRLQDIAANDRLAERFWQLLDGQGARDRLYVYRIDLELPEQPPEPIYKGEPFPGLMDFLRDEHGGGEFKVMFRRGRTMLLVGVIGVGEPPGRCQNKPANTPSL